MSDTTQLLRASQHGDPHAAEALLSLMYQELRRVAASKMAGGPPGQTLQPTALVHEAWLRLGPPEQQRWDSRTHFFAAAAETMRCILIDRARRRQRIRHGGDRNALTSMRSNSPPRKRMIGCCKSTKCWIVWR